MLLLRITTVSAQLRKMQQRKRLSGAVELGTTDLCEAAFEIKGQRTRILFVDVHLQTSLQRDGMVEQVGSPTEIYERPRTRFVADFIGEINILEGGGRARALRPEKIRLVPVPEARTTGKVETANYLGGSTLLRVRGGDGLALLVRETHAGERASRNPGDSVGLAWNDQDAVLLEG